MDHHDKVIDQLSSYYSEHEAFPNCVRLFGQSSVLKSFSCKQKHFLKSCEWIRSVVVQTYECNRNQILFETVINALNDHQPSKDNGYLPFAKVDTIEDFLVQLSSMNSEYSYLIVFENAEKLRDMDSNILPVFTKLQEFTGLNISCILSSYIPFAQFELSVFTPTIHVPDYSKNDLLGIFVNNFKTVHNKIIASIKKDPSLSEDERNRRLEFAFTLDQEFYKNYLNNFLDVSFRLSRDIYELQFYANKCYAAYYDPVIKSEIKINDVTNLWRNITKVLKVAFNTLRVGNVSASDLGQNEDLVKDSATEYQGNIRAFAQTLELPYYAKYLLIASFLGSHNDAKYDKRLFMKHHGKQKKRKQKVSKHSEKLNVQIGPKSFTIDRLLAIFYAILDEKVALSCNLTAQISTLVDLQFLAFAANENQVMEGTSRLQSTIGMDFAISIGRVVGFNVKQYLTDFH